MKLKLILGAGVAAAACAILASCADAPQRPAPRAYYSPRVQATPSTLTAEASVFEGYMRRARGIDASFSGPREVSEALQTGASHEPRQLETGMIAYAAVAALQEPRFVDAIRSNPNRAELARRLASDPALALELPGGEAAAARAAGALASQGEALREQGLRVKRAAYSVQHQAWSKKDVPNPGGRLARVKALSSEPLRASSGDSARLYEAMAQGARRSGPAGPAVTRALAVAALNVLGEPGQGHALMSEPRTASCLRIAKLNLYQCLAAAGPQYEDIFCLGQHAMADTGQCVVEATHPARVATRASYRR
ncbi:hypothetical protein [Phenylobacterium sp.]|uniref:hypothetical protein n=1 Tax=Phenylobacterium sp. TaxID=1871053 RepID=UPI002DF21475|nr:hypothetical protein [Phenylobacterium sp.]